MNSASPPPPPDPVATAQAQSASNIQTAQNQQQLNMVNQTNPYGSQTYQQNGTWDNGTPRYDMNTTLSAPEQDKQNQQWQFDKLTNQLGIDQTQKLSGLLSKPLDYGAPLDYGKPLDYGDPLKLDNQATEARLFDLGNKRLAPVMAERRAAQETSLRNQGFEPGTEAWNRGMRDVGQQENDAYNQLALTGRGQATNELLSQRQLQDQEMMGARTQRNQEMLSARNQNNQEMLSARNQPINETTALMSGGQVQQPTFGSTPTANVNGTDVAGLTMDAYRAGPLAQYQAQQQNRQAMMGGLFGLGGAAMGGWARGGFNTPGFMRSA